MHWRLAFNGGFRTLDLGCPPVSESCSVSTNLRCKYEWRHNGKYHSSGTGLSLGAGQRDVGGQYECVAKCSVRGQECRHTSVTLNVTCDMGKSPSMSYLPFNVGVISP